MTMKIECPVCGEVRDVPVNAPEGTRRWCRGCGAVLELVSLQPLQVVPVRRCAEDFGV
jgi:lysine biosynthesis protein LysW